MKLLKKAIACITLIIGSYSKSEGQFLAAPKQLVSQNQVFLNVGLEPEMVTTIGFAHLIGKEGKAFDIHLGGSLKLAPLLITKGAWRANFISFANWKMNEHWRSVLTSNIYLAHDHNRAGTMDGLGFELRATPAYYGKKWAKGFDAGWQYTLLTHIKHSEEAKKTFDERYPISTNGVQGPKNGWYALTASRFRVGLTGATSISNSVTLQFAGGSVFSIQKQGILVGFAHAQVPVYIDVSLRYNW
ncbi:MAG: hypothetical protein WKG06_46290 [Segetibacter sp.]